MVVVPENYPENTLSEEQAKEVLEQIEEEAFKATPDENRRFEGCYQLKGVAYVVCGTEKAAEWLREEVRKLTMSTVGPLQACPAKEIQPRVRVSALFPTQFVKLKDPRDLVKKVGDQNPSLDVQPWRIFQTKPGATHTLVCLEVNKESLEALRRLKMNVIFGLHTVTFRELTKSAAKNGSKGGANQPSAL